MSVVDPWTTLAPDALSPHRIDEIDGELDDVVIMRPDSVHIESMGENCLWGAAYVEREDRRFVFWVEAVNKNRIKVTGHWE